MLQRSTLLALALLATVASAQRPFETTTPGKPGSLGLVPVLTGSGPLFPGSSGNLVQLDDALASSSAALVLGFSELAQPFQDGVLGPSPDVLVFGLPVGPAGSLALPFGLDLTIPVDSQLWAQLWVDDPGASFGRSASNTLRLTVQPPSAARLFPGIGLPLPRKAELLHLADLDGDGLDDLVAPLEGEGIALFAGDGAGPPLPLPGLSLSLDEGVPTLDSGDLDGDGQRDLLFVRHVFTPHVGHETAFVLARGLGGGSFDTPEDLPLLWQVTVTEEQLALTDLDGDGQLDIVALAEAGTTALRVLTALGAGDGSFAAPAFQDLDGTAGRLAVGDLDADGRPDVVVASHDPNALQVLLNDGSGALTKAVTAGAPAGPLDLLLTDLDGDGALDAVTVEEDSEQLAAWPGLGDGGFGPPLAVPAGPRPWFVAAGDLDGDGLTDLAASNRGVLAEPGHTRVSWMAGLPGGGFGPPAAVETGQVGGSLALGDLDGDGRDDLLVGHGLFSAATGVALFLSRPADEPLGRVVAATTGFGGEHIVAGDLGGDGVPDVVVSRTNGLQVLTAGPGGPFASGALYALGGTPLDLELADMTGDGLLDVVFPSQIFPGTEDGVTVVPGLGGATLASTPVATAVPDLESIPNALDVGDLDGDGLADVVLSVQGLDGLWVLPGLGDGSFGTPASQATFFDPADVFLADLDLDGDLDTVTANGGSNRAAVQLGAGDGSLTQFAVYLMGGNPRSVAAADLDQDGVPDLISANLTSDDLSVRPGLGNGTFGAEEVYAVGGRAYRLTVGDADGDGLPDALVCLGDDDQLALLLGQEGGGLTPASLVSAGQRPSSAALVDLDGNGHTDLALLAADVRQLRVLLRD